MPLANGRGHHRAAHAIQARCFLDGFLQALIGVFQRFAQHSGRVLLAELAGKGLVEGGHHQIAGDVAGGMAAHAISNDDQRRGLRLAAFVVEIRRQERIFLIIPSACDLVAGDF